MSDSAQPENNSEKNKNLFEALSKAQGEIKAALKTAENPAFKKDGKNSTYADIYEVIEVIKEPASKNGLSVFFNFKTLPEGNALRDYAQYIIGHSSGERFVSEWVALRSRGQTSHDFGASNTYYRRQLLKAIYQIPEDDDDGNSQSLPDNGKKDDDQKSKGSSNTSSKSNQASAAKSAPKNHAPGADQIDPADFIVPFGKETKGKKCKEIPERQLVAAYDYANEQFKAGKKEYSESINNIGAFLASVGVQK